ncbi:TerB family tellurite resistance protein [Acidovorax temperans]|uniref:tellurite resistance TerB family protein n=1 Tax=Acidovorax temperans TaxID=80878 RepID=UPI0035B307B1
MRAYPRNSPQAVARILSLVLISDGHVSRTELEALSQHAELQQLGVTPQVLHGIVKTLCEDLLMDGFDGRSLQTRVGHDCLARLLAEVDDHRLQEQLIRLARLAAQSDHHVSEAEAAMIESIWRIWRAVPATKAIAKAESRFLPMALVH